MTPPFKLDALLDLLGGDREIIDHLEEAGFFARPHTDDYSAEEVEWARVAHVLVRELEVNWAGVEVILRMRTELLATRGQVVELVGMLRSRGVR